MNIADLASQLRALGIRSLAIELDTPVEPTYTAPTPTPTEGDTEPPPAEPRDPTMCEAPGCGEKREGLFGGSVLGNFCRGHAAQRAGVSSGR
jgi:hypothetical protein